MGFESPVRDWESQRRSVYQMKTPIGKARDEGNCSGAIRGGEEACEEVRQCSFFPGRVCRCLLDSSNSLSPPGLLPVKSARLRTETSCKAGSGGRVSTTSRSRSQLSDQVKGELVQRKFMFLSGETCPMACGPSLAPVSRHLRPKGWNAVEKSTTGEAGVSRGHSTEDRTPTITGRTKR
jgi:hypothetical protein